MTDLRGFGTDPGTMTQALDLDPGFGSEFRANLTDDIAYGLEVVFNDLFIQGDDLGIAPSRLVAALDAHGLVITTKARAEVGEAVECLDGTNISVIERDPSDGQWCISGDGSSEDDWHDTLQAAIAAGLKGIGRSM